MSITEGNEGLLEERTWLVELLEEFDDLEVTDTGLGMGQADLVYEREAGDEGERRRVSITMKIEEIP